MPGHQAGSTPGMRQLASKHNGMRAEHGKMAPRNCNLRFIKGFSKEDGDGEHMIVSAHLRVGFFALHVLGCAAVAGNVPFYLQDLCSSIHVTVTRLFLWSLQDAGQWDECSPQRYIMVGSGECSPSWHGYIL